MYILVIAERACVCATAAGYLFVYLFAGVFAQAHPLICAVIQ